MANTELSKLKIEKSDTLYYRRTRKKPVFLIMASVFAVILAFTLYKVVFNPVHAVKVSTVSQVYPSQAFTLLNASGYVVAQRRASVASKITGRLDWLGVEEGSKVKKGQIIAILENKDAKASCKEAAANLNNALSNLEIAKVERKDALLHFNRQKELLSHGIITQSEYDVADARHKRSIAAVNAAESALNASRASLYSTKVALNYTYIRAPFEAVVLTKNADIGDIVTPLGAAANAKAAVVTIADMDSLLVEADVSESYLQKVQAGQPCEIQLDALPDSRFRGIVHTIVPTADRSKATVMVKVKFLDKDNRILPEMSARVAFLERRLTPDEQKPKIALKSNAVIMRNGNTCVFVIKNGRAVEAPLFAGVQIGDMTEIIHGVKPGEKVVINPPKNFKDGARVKIKD